MSFNTKKVVTTGLAAILVGVTNQAVLDHTPASVAQRNTGFVSGGALILGAVGKAVAPNGFWDRASDGLLYGSLAIGSQPLTQIADTKIQSMMAGSTPATTPGTGTTPVPLVNVQRVTAAPAYRVATEDLADTYGGIGI